MRALWILAFVALFTVHARGSNTIFDLDNSTIAGLLYEKDFNALLVVQESAVSFFELSVQQILRGTKLGRFPPTPDGTAKTLTARIINGTHFVYCGERLCR